MNILFIHQNFPGQFRHLAPALASRGHRVVALSINDAPPLPGVQHFRYRPNRGTSQQIHPWSVDFETKVIRGEACGQAMAKLKVGGFTPDLVVAHPGWGEALFVKDVFPQTRLLNFIEFFYAGLGTDANFDPEFRDDEWTALARIRLKNANSLLALDTMDHGLSPTRWQWSTVPPAYRDKIRVIHDGIDTARITPDPQASLTLADGRVLMAGQPVITFVSRNLEPYRGFHIFMRALPKILAANPKAVALIIGADGVSYGTAPAGGGSWKAKLLAEVGDQLDPSRVIFAGRLAYPDFLRAIQLSAAHVYLTYPFVLSWSMLEAMSAGALVIGSRTPPVEEVITHGQNGLLVDFFDTDQLAQTVGEALAKPSQFSALRQQARNDMIARYDLQTHCLPAQLALVDDMLR